MKTYSFIFGLLCLFFCSYANRDSAYKKTDLKIIPAFYKSDFTFKNQMVLNSRSPYPTWPRDMDLTEGIILSIGGTCLIPLCLDLYNERRPISNLAIGGIGVYGICVATQIVYRIGFKGKKKKKQTKWDK